MVSLLAFISCQMLPTNKMADFGRAWYTEREHQALPRSDYRAKAPVGWAAM